MAINATDAAEKLEDGQGGANPAETASEKPVEAVEPDPGVDSPDEDSEAVSGRKGTRQKLAELKAELDSTRAALERSREAHRQAVLQQVGLDAEVAEAKGVTVAAYLNDDGDLDLDRLREAAEQARGAVAGSLSRRPKPNPLAGEQHTPAARPGWAEVLGSALPGART